MEEGVTASEADKFSHLAPNANRCEIFYDEKEVMNGRLNHMYGGAYEKVTEINDFEGVRIMT